MERVPLDFFPADGRAGSDEYVDYVPGSMEI
jgi:hypothetical protein